MVLSTTDFDFIRALVQKRSAIVLENEKVYLAESRLLPLARREGFSSVAELVARIRTEGANGLPSKVVDAMTTNETSFFRDIQPFEALRQVVLPGLIERRAAQRRLQIWCAASSSGQEPYTIAMVLREHFPQLGGWEIRIVASDLSTEILERGVIGRYSQLEVNRGLPARMLVKYFARNGTDWEVKPELRSLIEFRCINLIEPWPILPAPDVVFLRNVLIYFSVETKKQILGKVGRLLRPDGFLFLGGAETTLNLDDSFERVEFERGGCYRRRGQ